MIKIMFKNKKLFFRVVLGIFLNSNPLPMYVTFSFFFLSYKESLASEGKIKNRFHMSKVWQTVITESSVCENFSNISIIIY